MNSQIYLLLIRNSGGPIKKKKELLSALGLQKLLQGMVMGDSMDLPFIKFIRVSNVDHSISFPGTSTVRQYDKDSFNEENQRITASNLRRDQAIQHWEATGEGAADISAKPLAVAKKSDNAAWIDRPMGKESKDIDKMCNDMAKVSLPDHGDVSFSKWLDCATPQIAHGCCSQEVFPLAIFFYRRRIGVGIKGIRAPYLVMGLWKCRISSYSLSGDSESASLKYSNIAWSSIDTFGDSAVPAGLSQRYWDVAGEKGGTLGWPQLLAALAQGLVLASGAAFIGMPEKAD